MTIPSCPNSDTPAESIDQLSQCYVSINYLDMARVPYTPSAVDWRLWDSTNDQIVQDWTPVGGTLGTSSTITIPGVLNQLGDLTNLVEWRVVIFRIKLGANVLRYDPVYYTLNAVASVNTSLLTMADAGVAADSTSHV